MTAIGSKTPESLGLQSDNAGQLPVAGAADTRKELRYLARGQWWRIAVIDVSECGMAVLSHTGCTLNRP